MAIRRGAEFTMEKAAAEGLELWLGTEHGRLGEAWRGSAAKAHVFMRLEAPADLINHARELAHRRGAGFALEDAVREGLALWVNREHKRPRPEGNDARFLDALRMLCCQLLANAFTQLAEARDRKYIKNRPKQVGYCWL